MLFSLLEDSWDLLYEVKLSDTNVHGFCSGCIIFLFHSKYDMFVSKQYMISYLDKIFKIQSKRKAHMSWSRDDDDALSLVHSLLNQC